MSGSEPLLLAVDQGTSGTTCLAVSAQGAVRARTHRDVAVAYPRDGWAEQDANELWRSVQDAVAELAGGLDAAPVALGLTNQRETLVVFNRRTLEPVAPAIVWQCRRSAAICEEHRSAGDEDVVRSRTGLLLDPYFSATKLEWLLRERPELRVPAARGELCAGTVDTWLIARMTEGRALVTDASNASRTLLFDLQKGMFDPELCAMFGVPPVMLPEVSGSAARIAETSPAALAGLRIPVSGVAGDQQAALFGQACVRPGMSKNTYGTGSFLLVNVGEAMPPPAHGILTTVAWRVGGRDSLALEGSIFVTGAALRWLRDGLGLLDDVSQAGAVFESVPDAAGCHFIPALSGLGAPWWDPAARGAFLGLSAGTTRAHLVRAAVEAMAYRTRDVVEAMEAASGTVFSELRVDGGASVMDGLCQFQADLLGIPVARAATAETTAVGAAMLAAVGESLTDGPDAVAAAWRPGARFEPGHPGTRPSENYAAWLDALSRVRSAPPDAR
ncbi:MAG: glycerol kinase GlpK [Candidatus Dormibacteraeota bacterium]|nr:glycerol kinase GlpK [Candidatus Dormibacteraeota bacterium]